MLVYMSSYPRSGNSLMQQLINNYFEKPWTSVDVAKRPLVKITGTPENFINWRYRSDILETNQSNLRKFFKRVNNRFIKNFNINDWLAFYDLDIPPYTKNCRYLLPGCLNALTNENRRYLAESDEYFFVKTHWLPYESYLPKEYVIQIVRNPLNVFTSYLNFLRDFESVEKTLDDVILGKVPYGSWSNWHKEWNDTSQSLGERFSRLVFEETVIDKISACDKIENCISLPYNKSKSDITFEEMKKVNPKYYRSGQAKSSSNDYSKHSLTLVKQFHGEMMDTLGYSIV